MELIKLAPSFKDYLWGGTRLKETYNKSSDMNIIAESWELSTHKDGPSLIVSGEHKGKTLDQLVNEMPKEFLGENALKFPYFPLLTKFIDAKQNLSIQVHPDDEYGLRVESEFGKTEVWYILDCEKDSYLYFGVNKDLTKQEMRDHLNNGTFMDVMDKVPVKKGDVAFIEAGTIHAITEGIVILEIQQNSNSTYRVYDFDRVDVNGNKRELHIDKAIDVSILNKLDNAVKQVEYTTCDGYKVGNVAKCNYFNVNVYEVTSTVEVNVDNTSFVAFTIIEGAGTIKSNNDSFDFIKGDTFFAPANLGNVTISGTLKFVTAQV